MPSVVEINVTPRSVRALTVSRMCKVLTNNLDHANTHARTASMTTDERYITGCHEAGHAVAALMRGGGEITSITIKSTPTTSGTPGNGSSHLTARYHLRGPWAEARAQWTDPTFDGCDGDGCLFEDLVTAAFLRNYDGDATEYKQALDRDPAEIARRAGVFDELARRSGEEIPDREEMWSRQLECAWPVIQQLAVRLLAGPVSGEDDDEVVNKSENVD